MKKLIITIFAVFLFIGITGCTKKEETADMPNPVKEVETLDELIEVIDMAIYKVEADGVSDEVFKLIDGEYPIAEYDFKLNGKDVTVRASKAPAAIDISGVYFNENTLYGNYLDTEASCYIENDDYNSHRWFTIDGQYVITVDVNDFDYSEFDTLAKSFEEIRPLNWNSDVAYEDYRNLCSYYSTEDADMAAIVMEKDHVRIIVAVGKDEGAITFEMPAVLKDRELVFEGGTAVYSSYNSETGEMKSEELPSFGAGSVTVTDGQLSFENSGIPELANLVMKKFNYQ